MDLINIQVCDPKKIGDGIQAYTSYTVSSSDSQGTCSVVCRRYRDFLWLFRELQKSYLGCIVPPIPKKKLLGKFNPRLVEERRRRLQNFLQGIAQHEILQESSAFRDFRMLPDADFRMMTKTRLKSKNESNSSGSIRDSRWVGILKNKVSSLGVTRSLDKSPQDLKFNEISSKIEDTVRLLKMVSSHSISLRKACLTQSACLFDLGLSFSALGQKNSLFGGESEALMPIFKSLGGACDRMSSQLSVKVNKLVF